MDDAEREEQERQELLKLHFGFFKHFTTLGAATVVVILVVFREGVSDPQVVAVTLTIFGLAVLIAVIGMYEVAPAVQVRRCGRPDGLPALVWGLRAVRRGVISIHSADDPAPHAVFFIGVGGALLLGYLGTRHSWVFKHPASQDTYAQEPKPRRPSWWQKFFGFGE